jgi:hypothetical protein
MSEAEELRGIIAAELAGIHRARMEADGSATVEHARVLCINDDHSDDAETVLDALEAAGYTIAKTWAAAPQEDRKR